MATLMLPSSPNFKSARFGLVANTRTFRAPVTKSVQTLELAGALWSAQYELPIMVGTGVNAANWTTFLSELMGEAGRFSGYDPRRRTPRGSIPGTPLVMGASQTGKSITTDGWGTNETGVLLKGDYFSVNGEYKKVTDTSVNSDGVGSGEATINFVPPLRASPANDAPLTVTGALVTMKLTSDAQSMWDEDIIMHGFSFSAEEAFI